MLAPQLPVPRGKKGPPFFKDWQLKSPDELEELLQRYPNSNRGLRLDYHIQVDPDNEAAIRRVKQFQAEGILPPTLTYITWRGRECSLYRVHRNIPSSFDITAEGMELQIRTDSGHYCLIPDSVVRGKPYRWAKHLGPADVDVSELPDEAVRRLHELAHINKRISSREGCHDSVTQGRLNFRKGARDESLYHVARCCFKGGMTPLDAKQLIKILAKNCQPAFPEQDALRKIESAFKEERNLALEIRDWLSVTKALFTVTECDTELNIVTKRDKDNRRQILHRLANEGEITRVEGRAGTYRVIEKECPVIDFLTADTGKPLSIKWPFELERLVNFYRKNIAIVAGSKDAGKTAFMLNLVRLNQDRFPVNYLSSEMAAEELALRLSKFDFPLDSWKFSARERSFNFSDVIRPDSMNIIDFFEITDNFFLIAGELRKIHDKLRNGVAVIAIQKDDKAELGRGKGFSLEKARLYITLDRRGMTNELKIVSGKNWAQPGVNPAGTVIKFKLVNGAKFIELEEK
jgi:hypothetical protein